MISRIYLAALFTWMASLVETGYNHNEDACRKIGMNPSFDPKLVLGPQWRIYYTWNFKKNGNCLAMKFYDINPSIVGRFYKDMGQYLVKQPSWTDAILHVTIGAAKHQILFLADFGPAGRVHGVANLTQDPTFMKYKKKKSVPLMQVQMKLLQGGKYLVMMDCLQGTATLSKRDSEVPPYASEIESVAKELAIGQGTPACPSTHVKRTTVRSLPPPPDYDHHDQDMKYVGGMITSA